MTSSVLMWESWEINVDKPPEASVWYLPYRPVYYQEKVVLTSQLNCLTKFPETSTFFSLLTPFAALMLVRKGWNWGQNNVQDLEAMACYKI
jgi:hypothetical protein